MCVVVCLGPAFPSLPSVNVSSVITVNHTPERPISSCVAFPRLTLTGTPASPGSGPGVPHRTCAPSNPIQLLPLSTSTPSLPSRIRSVGNTPEHFAGWVNVVICREDDLELFIGRIVSCSICVCDERRVDFPWLLRAGTGSFS